MTVVLHHHLLAHVKTHWRVSLALAERYSGCLLSDFYEFSTLEGFFFNKKNGAVSVCLYNPALLVCVRARQCVGFSFWPRKDAVETEGKSLDAQWNGKISVCHCWLPLCHKKKKSSNFFFLSSFFFKQPQVFKGIELSWNSFLFLLLFINPVCDLFTLF